MNKQTSILIKTSFEGFHKYENAPEEVSFLRVLHRHTFNVEVEMETFHNDREIEFIMVQHELKNFFQNKYEMKNTYSCEQIAEDVCKFLLDKYGTNRKIKCLVLEDNENGGSVSYGY